MERTMGKRNARVGLVKRSALGAVGIKSEACDALDGNLQSCGQGLCRDVYVNKTRTIVYKVAGGKAGHPKSHNVLNESEFDNMVALRSDPETKSLHTPLTLMYVDGCAVIAMVYRPIDGKRLPVAARYRMADVAADKGILDMHDGNYRGTPTGRVKVTDLGDVDRGQNGFGFGGGIIKVMPRR